MLFKKEISEFEFNKIVEMDSPSGLKLFAMRIHDEVSGSIPHPQSGYLVGFSRTCTHMKYSPLEPKPKKMICGPCPWHGSVFDLARGGLVIIGHATQNLPQMRLEIYQDGDTTFVQAIEWIKKEPAQSVDPNLIT